jgi:hypothetical protein
MIKSTSEKISTGFFSGRVHSIASSMDFFIKLEKKCGHRPVAFK